MPIIPAVSARSFGAIRSTKSSKSTLPPTGGKIKRSDTEIKTQPSLCLDSLTKSCVKLTVHVDILAQLDQLHLRGHVAHRPHEIPQVLTADQPVLVFIELVKRITQLCSKTVRTISGSGGSLVRFPTPAGGISKCPTEPWISISLWMATEILVSVTSVWESE